MLFSSNFYRALFVIIFAFLLVAGANAQGTKRIVVIKVDGLPAYYVDRFVRQKDPETGKSILPWFDEIFYKNGTRVPNFYTRGMSLSGPSWGQMDSGQHLQIKGNVEYDRYTAHAYDYLNFVPYYMGYGLNKKVDMPAVEVMDQLKIPLLCDVFPFTNRYTSQQLYQRGNDWGVLANGFMKLYPGDPSDFIDEWTMGLNFRKMTIDQAERDVIRKIASRPDIDYFDYYDVSFDHVSHHNNDSASRLVALQDLDRTLGRIWEAIKDSDRASETALVLVSDHGFNSDDRVYSQGFNLVKLLGSREGGAHHVVTKRRLMLDYSIKGLYPLVPLIKTASSDTYYLKGQSSDYPTALVDFDGNERSSIHLRDSDLNVLHILLQQLKRGKLTPDARTAVTDAVLQTIEKHRSAWQDTVTQMGQELDALHRWIESQDTVIATFPQGSAAAKLPRGVIEQNRRIIVQREIAVESEADYRKYIATLGNLLRLNRDELSARKFSIEDLIAPGAMGEANSVFELQNYVVGLSAAGVVLDPNKGLDLDKSFTRVNYFDLLHEQKVRNNVQDGVANRPVDFVAVRIPLAGLTEVSSVMSGGSENPIWLYGDTDKQALIFSRAGSDGVRMYRYMPISDLRQDVSGKITFEQSELAAGFPLKYFEDNELALLPSAASGWLTDWHTEVEWLNVVHKTKYSNAIIGINEQLDRHPLIQGKDQTLSADDSLIERFRQRQRHLTEADLLILANDHWNFDVRGFNPGGNHGSFFRVSTNSTFMIAGGARTGIPRGLAVSSPYDSLSFVPTVLKLLGKIDAENQPAVELREKGFKKFPGRVIREITNPDR